MSKVFLIGEPMIMFIAQTEGKLEDAEAFTRAISGSEVNVGVGLRRLGHEVTYVTSLGKDPFGRYIKRFLDEEKVDTSFIRWDSENPTGFQLKQKALEPEVCYFRKGSATSKISLEFFNNFDIGKYDHLHLTGIFPALSPSTLEVTIELAKMARRKGITVSYDPNLRPTLWPNQDTMIRVINQIAALSDFVMPGIHEGELLTGRTGEKAITDFYMDLGAKAVMIKFGPNGAYLKTPEQAIYSPAFREDKKVDTVGAGDGFAVGVISATLEGLSLEKAVERGNAIGTMQIMSPYDNKDLPDRQTLEAFMKTHGPIQSGAA
jgi:2-dehydro-3-deoxygluconokinase